MRGLLLGVAIGLLAACADIGQLTPTPRTALEQRLAQGTRARAPSPSPTIDLGPPEPTWTPPPFGRRTTPTALGPLSVRPAQILGVDSEQSVRLTIDGREEAVAYVGVLPLARSQVGRSVECFGEEAVGMLRQAMPVGSSVDLEEDSAVAVRDDRGRRRLYVWLPDGRLVNMELLRQGFGQIATGDARARHYLAFRSVEREAAREGLGLWSNLSCHGSWGRATG